MTCRCGPRLLLGSCVPTDWQWPSSIFLDLLSRFGNTPDCALEFRGTHQIRCHMAHIGHPLVGDVKYGGTLSAWCQRLPLHCLALRAKSPEGPVSAFAPLPPDFQKLLGALEENCVTDPDWQQLVRERCLVNVQNEGYKI